jgi:hypothetical protein
VTPHQLEAQGVGQGGLVVASELGDGFGAFVAGEAVHGGEGEDGLEGWRTPLGLRQSGRVARISISDSSDMARALGTGVSIDTASVSPRTWWAACTPAGGEALGSDF